jgi:F-box-like
VAPLKITNGLFFLFSLNPLTIINESPARRSQIKDICCRASTSRRWQRLGQRRRWCCTYPLLLVQLFFTHPLQQVSLPGTPGGTRPSSPTRFSSSKPIRGPLHLPSDKSKTDPLRKLPTEISQKIFARLPITTLAKCALVSRKWSKSQTLNYGKRQLASDVKGHSRLTLDLVWFQHYRKENFHDESLPPGKWTRRESKQNWVRVIGFINLYSIADHLMNSAPST